MLVAIVTCGRKLPLPALEYGVHSWWNKYCQRMYQELQQDVNMALANAIQYSSCARIMLVDSLNRLLAIEDQG